VLPARPGTVSPPGTMEFFHDGRFAAFVRR